MRPLLLSICLLLALSTITMAEQISLVAPVSEAELVESHVPGSVVIQLKLRTPESDSETQASLDDIQFLDCTAVVGTRRAVVGLSGIPTETVRTCHFMVGTASNNLPPDWNKITLEVKYRVRPNGGGPYGSPVVFSGLSPITRCVKVSDLTATLDKPARTGEREISVPIKLNADARLNVRLKNTSGATVATPSGRPEDASFLFETDQSKTVVLKVVPGTVLEALTHTYSVVLEQLPSQPAVNVQMKGVPASFTVNTYVPYRLPDPTISMNDDRSWRVEFSTTPVSGSMQVFLNGKTDPIYRDDNGVSRTFVIPANQVSAGVNTLSFVGESFQDRLKLSGTTSTTFVVQPVTYLKDTPVTFDIDESTNTLKIKFALSQPLNTRWRFKGAEGLGANVQPAANGLYEATIPLNLSSGNAAIVESKLSDVNPSLRRAPVEIEIHNQTNNSEIVASFVINFYKPKTHVKEKLEAANSLIANNHRDQAKAAIIEALGFAGSLNDEQKKTIEAIMSQFKSGDSTKSKIFKALAFAGRFAAGMFGVPLL
ncbi:MAG TPA: hypothetical protein VFR78_05095 [Pyrinomonadaceae bacterium]|nr:hypothetical protein [Pyrinomonadaceae bacterium]